MQQVEPPDLQSGVQSSSLCCAIMTDEEQKELVAAVRELFALLEHIPEGAYKNEHTRWCFLSLSRDGAKFDNAMDRISRAMPKEEKASA